MEQDEPVYRLILPGGPTIEIFACGKVCGVPPETLVFNNFPILQRALVGRFVGKIGRKIKVARND